GYRESVDVTGMFTIQGQPMRGTVSVAGEGLQTDTDNMGIYLLEGVPAGLHTFYFKSGSGDEYAKEVFISKYASTEVNLHAGVEMEEMPEFTRSFEDLDARYYGTAIVLVLIASLGAYALKKLDRMPSLAMGASAASLMVLFLAYGSETLIDLLSFVLLGISSFCLALTIPLVARRRLNALTE
ncbi:MAG: hypothetical protein QCI38_09235, partial [Candidatus Thermoplasmatota archaeon]|nr:hypothetical protein [Candidatus Thermoplasmatota archaeon]